MEKLISIVVPCYNEGEVLVDTAKALYEKANKLIEMKKISEKSRIVFVLYCVNPRIDYP